MSASELSSLCNKSRSSISIYLAEICAIVPDFVEKQSVRRLLRNPGHGTEELLDVFCPIFRTPSRAESGLPGVPAWMLSARQERCFPERARLPLYRTLPWTIPASLSRSAEQACRGCRKHAARNGSRLSRCELCLPEVEIWSYPIDRPSTIDFLQQSCQVLICSTCMSHARRHHQATSDIKTP